MRPNASIFLSLVACGGAPDGAGGAPTSASRGASEATTAIVAPAITYHRDVRPLLEAHCASCHAPGGAAPIWMGDTKIVLSIGEELVGRVERGEMPPHLPRDGCRDIVSAPLFPETGIATLLAWRDAGLPEGDPATYPGPAPVPIDPRPALGAPTTILSVPAFTPQAGSDDQVIEQVIDVPFAADTWIYATEISPGAAGIVHHATAFLDLEGVPPPDVPAPTAIVGAWAPGYAPLRLPEGSALLAPAGARVRVLVHYSVIGLGPNDPVPADTTTIRFWTLPAGARPAQQAFFDAMSASDLFLPAGASDVPITGEAELRYPDAPIVGVMPHMHLLGTAFRADVVHADGTSSCLVDAPDYDFHHQALYLFSEAARVTLAPGDRHRMTCTFDNSPANQPLVNGERKISVDVSWGDASTDEMCQNALLRVASLK